MTSLIIAHQIGIKHKKTTNNDRVNINILKTIDKILIHEIWQSKTHSYCLASHGR